MTRPQVVIDFPNAPSFEVMAVMEFFEASGRNLLAPEASADVRQHAIHRRDQSGARPSPIPRQNRAREIDRGFRYLPQRFALQFLEFLGATVDASTDERVVRLPPGRLQPIVADDVAVIINEVPLASPRTGSSRSGRNERPSLFGDCG